MFFNGVFFLFVAFLVVFSSCFSFTRRRLHKLEHFFKSLVDMAEG